MAQIEFKVCKSKTDVLIFTCCFLVIQSALIWMIFSWEHVLLCTVFAVALFLICFSTLISTLLFYVKVSSSSIKVRTQLGRKHQFSCLDIKKVVCSERQSVKYGLIIHLTLSTESVDITMDGQMKGFHTMAEYILEKYETGEIRPTAVSESCKKKLLQYKNSDIFKKKK